MEIRRFQLHNPIVVSVTILMMSEGSIISEIHSSLLNLPAYTAHEDFELYAHWAQLDGRETTNQLVDLDDNPALVVVVSQVMQGRLAVAPLGNFQVQEDKRQGLSKGNSYNRISCKDAKMQIFVRHPTAYPEWVAEYDMAANHLNRLQEVVATTQAPRQWFLEQTQKYDQQEKHFLMKFNHCLWQKKKISGKDAVNVADDDDDNIRNICEDERDKAQETSMYTGVISERFMEQFNVVRHDHHIRCPPVFLLNGQRISPGVLEARCQ